MLSTRFKVRIARMLYAIVRTARRLAGRPGTVQARRGGIMWELDLAEGIDLAIYLLGGFEKASLKAYRTLVKPGDIIFDIGANIGAHALPLALAAGQTGHVHAFEPTVFAFDKMRRNARLNPSLAPRLTINLMMLTDSDIAELPGGIYSSWPLDDDSGVHDLHRGRLKSTDGAVAATLDSYVAKAAISRLNLIKLDVDGNELQVLGGARQTLDRFRPIIIAEMAPYVHDSRPGGFAALVGLWRELGYSFSDARTGAPLPGSADALRRVIPEGGAITVIARHGAADQPG